MLNGEYGIVTQKAMKMLVTIGDVFGAKRLKKIISAHVSGISYNNIGEPGLNFLENWAKEGAITRVYTTINPCGIDIERWKEFGISEKFAEKQIRIIKAFENMRIKKSLTCTPYLIGNKPKEGEHIAWAESSAIVYANSILGAKTNREGGPTALASAITGRTPLFGYHLEENRKPTHVINVTEDLSGVLEYSTLGYHVGKLGECIPLFKGLKNPRFVELKALCAGLASSGMIALYYIKDYNIKKLDKISVEKMSVDKLDLVKTLDKLSIGDVYEHICIGCPHCSLLEIVEIAKKVTEKKLKRKLWIFTSSIVCKKAKRNGCFSAIEKAGGKIISDTCMVVAPMREMGVNGIITNSCKAAHYVPNTSRVPVSLKNLDVCINTAIG